MRVIQRVYVIFHFVVGIVCNLSGHLKGDVSIGCLLKIWDNEGGVCNKIDAESVRNYEMIKWTITKLNDANYTNGIQIGIDALPTCRSVSEAVEATTAFLSRSYKDRTDEKPSGPPIVGIIGPEYSSEVKATSSLISSLSPINQLLQISFSATAASLSNAEQYANLLRVIPSDSEQIQVMVSLLESLKWNYIAVIYENDTYGLEGFKNLKLKANARSICITKSFPITIGQGLASTTLEVNDAITSISENAESPITGVIVFATSSTVKLILRSTKVNQIPLMFVFSESVNIDETVFKSSDYAKGSFALTPSRIDVPDFLEHWKTILTNTTYLQIQGKSNPWLYEVFYSYTNCRLSANSTGQECKSMTSSEADVTITENLYESYAFQAAVTFAKVLKLLQEKYCDGYGLCDSLKQILYRRKGDLVQEKTNLYVDFEEELPNTTFRLNITFTGQNDATHLNNFGFYEIYHYRSCLKMEDSFCLENVGHFSVDHFYLNTELLRDYYKDPNGSPWPNFNTAECSVHRTCSSCLTSALPDQVYFQDGDVFVGAVVPVYNKDTDNPLGCNGIRTALGWEIAEAIAYAVNLFNDKNGTYSSYFKNKQVGYFILNSCNQPLYIQSKLLSIIKNGLQLPNGTIVNIVDKTMAFVAAYSTDLSMKTAEILQMFKFVQVAYASTGIVLSDRSKYKYFARVTPPDNKQSEAVVRMVKDLQSQYVQVLYSDDIYGNGLFNAFKTGIQRQICIANALEVQEGVYSKLVDDLRMHPYASVVMVFLRSHVVYDVFTILDQRMSEGEFTFIGSEGWGTRQDILKFRITKGAITLSLKMTPDPTFSKYLYEKDIIHDHSNPWTKEYFQKKLKCYFDNSFDKSDGEKCQNNIKAATSMNYTQEIWTPFAMNAMIALLKGANEAFNYICGKDYFQLCSDFRENPELIRNYTINELLVIDNSGNTRRVFDENGDGNIGYQINQIQKDPLNPQSLRYFQVGRISPQTNDYEFDVKEIKDDFKLFHSNCPNGIVCKSCDNENQKIVIIYRPADNTAIIAVGVFCGVLMLIIVVFIIFFVKRHHEKEEPRIEDNYRISHISADRPDENDYDRIKPFEFSQASNNSENGATSSRSSRQSTPPTGFKDSPNLDGACRNSDTTFPTRESLAVENNYERIPSLVMDRKDSCTKKTADTGMEMSSLEKKSESQELDSIMEIT